MPSVKDLIVLSALLLQAFPTEGYRAVDHHIPLHASIHPYETCSDTDQGLDDGKDGAHAGGGNNIGETTVTVIDW
jgi:hypothetical protein